MSAPPAKKSKQNDGKANPQQPQKQQQQGKKQQQQGGKPQQPSQKPKQPQQQQGKKEKQPQQQQQQAADGQKLSKNQKKKLKKQQAAAATGGAAPAPAKPAPAKKQDKKPEQKSEKKDSKKRPLEQKEPEQETQNDDNEDDDDDDGFDISDECLEAMSEIQGKLDAVERKGAKEMAVIEKKMAVERHPLYLERATQLRTIPHVWREIFTTVDVFSNELQETDIEILEFLENVFITDHAFEGFETDFEFASNPIFSNKKLSINLKFPPPSDDDEEEEDDDQEQATATVTPVEWKDASYPTKHPNSWFVRFFTQNFIDDYDNQQTLQFLRDHVWPSPLEALSGALNNEDDDDDDMDPMMMENSDDDDGEAPDLVPADDDEDEE